jgi:hypothetical protein
LIDLFDLKGNKTGKTVQAEIKKGNSENIISG